MSHLKSLLWAVFLFPFCCLAVGSEKVAKSITEKFGSEAGFNELMKSGITAAINNCGDNERSDTLLVLQVSPTRSGDFVISTANLNIKGTKSRTSIQDQRLSGICSNGFIRCQTGWQDCKGFRWVFTGTDIIADRVASSQLGNCHCLNASCGASPSLLSILNRVGNGLALTLSKAGYTVVNTKNEKNDTLILYGGKPSESQECSVSKESQDFSAGSLKPSELTRLNGAQLKQQGAERAIQSTSFNALQKRLTEGTSQNSHTCDMVRHAVIDDLNLEDAIFHEKMNSDVNNEQCGSALTPCYLPGAGKVDTCGEGCLLLTVGDQANNNLNGNMTMYVRDVRFVIRSPEQIVSAKLVRAYFDDWLQVFIGNTYIWSGPFNNWSHPSNRPPGEGELNKSWFQEPDIDITSHFRKKGEVVFRIRLEVTDRGEGFVQVKLQGRNKCELKESIEDGCQSLGRNPECSLVSERLVSTEAERIVQSAHCLFAVHHPDWHRERRYHCISRPSNIGIDRSLARKDYVETGSTPTKIKDMMTDTSGSVTYDAYPLHRDRKFNDLEPCIPYCKVAKNRPQTDVASGNSLLLNNQKQSMKEDREYKRCIENRCPLEKNEKMLLSCGCHSEFSEATLMMEVMSEAARDTECAN